MHILRLIFLFASILAGVKVSQAQTMQVESFTPVNSATTECGVKHFEFGDSCALIIVKLASPQAEFFGNIVGSVSAHQDNEYHVYMSCDDSRTQYLKVFAPGYMPICVDFSQIQGIDQLQPGQIYLLIINIPDDSHPNPGCDNSDASYPEHLDLACVYKDKWYYFSEKEWSAMMSAEQSRFDKIGVVVIGNGERFIVDLNNIEDKSYTVEEAVTQFGASLPTEAQAVVMMDCYKALNNALIFFGGEKLPYEYWKRTEDKSLPYWASNLYSLGLISNVINKVTSKVRTVHQLPEQ